MSYLFGVTRLLSINNKPIRITAVEDSWLIHKPKPHMAIFNSFDLILVELNRWKRKPWSSSCTLYAFMRSRGSTLGPSSESWFWSSVRTVSSMLRSKTQEDRDGEVQVNSWRGRICLINLLLKRLKTGQSWRLHSSAADGWSLNKLHHLQGLMGRPRPARHREDDLHTFPRPYQISGDKKKQFNASNVEFGVKKAVKHLMNMEERGMLSSFIKLE